MTGNKCMHTPQKKHVLIYSLYKTILFSGKLLLLMFGGILFNYLMDMGFGYWNFILFSIIVLVIQFGKEVDKNGGSMYYIVDDQKVTIREGNMIKKVFYKDIEKYELNMFFKEVYTIELIMKSGETEKLFFLNKEAYTTLASARCVVKF